MKNNKSSWLKFEFEYRIFVSLSIVLLTCLISFGLYAGSTPLYGEILKSMSLNGITTSAAYLTAAVIIGLVSILRMWSGSVLSSEIVMTFRVRTDSLSKEGPYQLVRNPIYLADWIAILVFSLFLPPIGLMMPILFYVHYVRLIAFEEASLCGQYKKNYIDYINSVPRFLPNLNSLSRFVAEIRKFKINYDGFRHNALYILFVPGLIAAAWGDSFIYAVVIGVPGVIDWAIVHTEIGVEKEKQKKNKVFEGILYAQCWEDPQIDRTAFNINSKDVVFTITSGGCNALTFLLDNAEKVLALDLNPHQNYLLELKIAAMKRLSYDELLQLMGVRKSTSRIELYNESRDLISIAAQVFWDDHPGEIKKGLIHSGRYEKYMRLLRRILIILIGKGTINRLFCASDASEKQMIYNKKWDNLRWKLFTRVLLSRQIMSFLFTSDFFKYLDKKFSFGKNFSEKVKRAVTKLPLTENYFLTYILYGNYNQEHLPPYLQRNNYEKIQSRLNRIKIITGGCSEYFKSLTDSTISRFNFTNIFEWMSAEEFEKLLNETIRVAKNNSIITYRNLLVRRKHPAILDNQIRSCNELAEKLHDSDLSFIYDSYVVEKIYKEEKNVVQNNGSPNKKRLQGVYQTTV